MIYCDEYKLEKWVAPPQEDFPRPTWTKLYAGGKLLSNSIEFADWQSRPIFPFVCESCWGAGCHFEVPEPGLANIVRVGDHLLWIPPHEDSMDEVHRDRITQDDFINELVLFPIELWDKLVDEFSDREQSSQLPGPYVFPLPTRRDIAELWLRTVPENLLDPYRPNLNRRAWPKLLAADQMETEVARAILNHLREWLRSGPEEPVSGRIVKPAELGFRVNTLHFLGNERTNDAVPEWPAFCDGLNHALMLEDGWAFQPDEPFV